MLSIIVLSLLNLNLHAAKIQKTSCDKEPPFPIILGQEIPNSPSPFFTRINMPSVGNFKGFGCSVSLISPEHIIAAGHCKRGNEKEVTFDKYLDVPPEKRRFFKVEEKLQAELIKDSPIDYAIYKVKGRPGDIYGWRAIADTLPEHGELISVLQVPQVNYSTKSICFGPYIDSKKHERYEGQEGVIAYKCSTSAKASGSPIINKNGLLLGVHTLGGCDNKLYKNINSGFSILEILKRYPALEDIISSKGLPSLYKAKEVYIKNNKGHFLAAGKKGRLNFIKDAQKGAIIRVHNFKDGTLGLYIQDDSGALKWLTADPGDGVNITFRKAPYIGQKVPGQKGDFLDRMKLFKFTALLKRSGNYVFRTHLYPTAPRWIGISKGIFPFELQKSAGEGFEITTL